MTFRDLRLRVRALLAPRRTERDLDDELAFHVERETHRHIVAGMNPDEARARARALFGSSVVVAEECRDARGTTFVSTSVRDIRYALRTFRHFPAVAVTIVGTIAIGLGLVAAVFTIFNTVVFRTDAVRDPGALFAVELGTSRNAERVGLLRVQYEALLRETDVFADAFAALPGITSRIDGHMMEGHLVTGNFFDVLGVNAALGRTLTPTDDTSPDGLPVMVLSHNGWSRLFAGDLGVIGRTVVVSGSSYEIVGVAPEGFSGLGFLAPDYWAPLAGVGQFRPWFAGREDAVGVDVVGRLKPDLSPETAIAALNVWVRNGRSADGPHTPTAFVQLESRRTPVPLSAAVLLGFSPLFFAFGLVLMIGCANVANLLLARGVSRQREIGIRLSLGASRGRVVRQLLTESLILGLAAAAGALAVSRLVLDGATAVLVSTIPAEFAEYTSAVNPSMAATDWRVVLFIVVAAVISTVSFGLMPALATTRLDLLRTMRGEPAARTFRGRFSSPRNMLIVAQVTASALLLIAASIFLRSALRSATVDPGLRTADTVIVDIVNEPFRTAMVQAVRSEPYVTQVAASWREPLTRPRAAFASDGTSPAAGLAGRLTVDYRFVSPVYFSVLEIPLVRGRPFTAAEAGSKVPVVVVSEATASKLWPHIDAVGQVLRLESDPDSETRAVGEPELPSRMFTVVGVARDVAGFRILGYPEAGIYVPTMVSTEETALILRVQGDPDAARTMLLARLTPIDPNMGMVMTMRTLGRLETYPLQLGFWLTVALGGLALMLTLSGIYSVLAYLIEQRRREIGVRIALGATARNVTRLVLSQSLRVVGVGLAIGTILAWALATLLMSTPAATRIGAIVDLFDPIAYLSSLATIVIACAVAASLPAMRAARIDPIATLRQD